MPDLTEHAAREAICRLGASIFSRGLTFGSSGNISARVAEGGWVMTPTNASLGELDPAQLSRIQRRWQPARGRSADKRGFPASSDV